MISELTCHRYRPDDRAELRDFRCGDREDYEIEIAEWIQDQHEGCISDDIRNGYAEEVYV